MKITRTYPIDACRSMVRNPDYSDLWSLVCQAAGLPDPDPFGPTHNDFDPEIGPLTKIVVDLINSHAAPEHVLAALDGLCDEYGNWGCSHCSGCRLCHDCTGCANCTSCANCTDCHNCTRCTSCTRCDWFTNCAGCTNCLGCDNCAWCTDCTRCNNCTNCTLCFSCVDCTDCFDCIGCTNNANCTKSHATSEPPRTARSGRSGEPDRDLAARPRWRGVGGRAAFVLVVGCRVDSQPSHPSERSPPCPRTRPPR